MLGEYAVSASRKGEVPILIIIIHTRKSTAVATGKSLELQIRH